MIKVVKIGGNVVDKEQDLRSFCRDFAALEGPKVLVHGGGAVASQIQRDLGMEPQMIEGRRVTDEATLKIVSMVYAGWCNKHIVSLLQAEGCNAIGLAGCDGSVIKAQKRAPRILLDGKTVVDYGFVGDVTKDSINGQFILQLIEMGLVPVFCAINHDAQGNLLNTNADTIASSIASKLSAQLLYCFEKNGVLYDKDQDDSVIPFINPELFTTLKAEGVIAGGMIPKVENALKALNDGANSVIIKNSGQLLEDKGTKISL